MKSNSNLYFFLVAIASIFIGCGKTNEETIDLKLNYKVGDVDRIYAATVTTGEIKYQNVMEMDFTIDSVIGDKNVIAVKVLRISSESDAFGEKESYDSKKKIDQMTESEKSIHLSFQDILDKSFLVAINNKGKTLESFKSKETNQPSEDIIDIANIYIPFPDEPVKIGSDWKGERINSITKAKTISTYEVTNITEKEIIISIVSEIGEIPGVLKSNTAKGEYVLDKKTCRIITGEFLMNLQNGKGKVGFKFASKQS